MHAASRSDIYSQPRRIAGRSHSYSKRCAENITRPYNYAHSGIIVGNTSVLPSFEDKGAMEEESEDAGYRKGRAINDLVRHRTS